MEYFVTFKLEKLKEKAMFNFIKTCSILLQVMKILKLVLVLPATNIIHKISFSVLKKSEDTSLIIRVFFYLGFFSRTFTNYGTAGEGGGNFINSSLPLPTISQTLRHQSRYYCRELTSAHSQQLDLNREPLISKRKSYTSIYV